MEEMPCNIIRFLSASFFVKMMRVFYCMNLFLLSGITFTSAKFFSVTQADMMF